MLRRKPTTAPKRDRTGEFDLWSHRNGPPRAVVVGNVVMRSDGVTPAFTAAPPKIDKRVRVRHDIRESARGEDCLIVLPGCPQDRERTIWSHNRLLRAGKGRGMKSLCVLGCYGCTYCDAIYDGQAPLPHGWTKEMVLLAWYAAHDKSLVKLAQKGLI